MQCIYFCAYPVLNNAHSQRKSLGLIIRDSHDFDCPDLIERDHSIISSITFSNTSAVAKQSLRLL